MEPLLYLASESPRRGQLLDQMRVPFERVDQDVVETLERGESPEVFVLRLALEKARVGHANLGDRTDLPVLGADTVVVLDEEVMGKPQDQSEADAMLARLSGQTHRVLTGVAMTDGEREATRLSVSNVTLREISEAERAAYWRSGEPKDKAGGYAIQGLGAVFVEHLDGSYSGVMGLPLFETADMFGEFDLNHLAQW